MNVMERMEAINADKKIADFRVKQQLPYEAKVTYAHIRAWEFYNECQKRGLNCHKRKFCPDRSREWKGVKG